MNPIKDLEISGKADYVLGYDPLFSESSQQFESCLIIVEVKRKQFRRWTRASRSIYGYVYSEYLSCKSNQSAVGVHQHRKNLTDPKRIVATVYGMVSDGLEW